MKQKHIPHANRIVNHRPLPQRLFFIGFSILVLVIFVLLISAAVKIHAPDFGTIFQRVSIIQLLLFTLYTLLRLLASYILVLVVTFMTLIAFLSHRKLEYFLLPVFDILQSVPVLAFFPLIIIVFAQLHLPELAAQIVLITAMLWPVLFGAIGGVNQIPEDILDAAQIYGANGWKKFRYVIFPAIFPALVTGSIISIGSGWNVIIISEYINYGNIQIRLPGLGNLISSTAGKDTGVFILSIVTLVLTIIVINRLVWHRLLAYAEKFKFE